MKKSHFTTPRQLRDATLTGIGFTTNSEPSPLLFIAGFFVGFLIGAIL